MRIIFFLLFLNSYSFFPCLYAQRNYPEWAAGIVWYQIFPERFANGDTSNDPEAAQVFAHRNIIPGWKITPWTSNWFTQSDWEKSLKGELRHKLTMRRYGGDLQGVIDHLDYIRNLGIDAIYFNPIFQSVSMHKYDASTYHHIDVNYGPDPEGDRKIMDRENPADPASWKWTSADKLFLKLVREVHKRKMRIIIDGVFNHTGTDFWAFKDIIKNRENSRFLDWYMVKTFDDTTTKDKNEMDYKCWWNYKAMPEFSRTNHNMAAGPKQYLFNCTKRWMDPDNNGDLSDGIDGWRLDVARDLPQGFWRDWNSLVKTVNHEAYIVGELWELSPDFVGKDDTFDALMNYNFAFAVNKFFIAQKDKIRVSEFINKLKEIDKTYPEKTLHILQNLVDSHDTDRLSSMIENPDREYDKNADENNPSYNPGKPDDSKYEIQKLICAFQMTYRGAPMIYYGDEAGMWGADDPHDRKPMIWDSLIYDDEVIDSTSGFKTGFGRYKVEVKKDILEFYRKMITLRHSSPALKKGSLEFIYFNDKKNTFIFRRAYKEKRNSDTCIVAFNMGKEEDSFDLKSTLPATEMISNEYIPTVNNRIKINMLPNSVKLYRINK